MSVEWTEKYRPRSLDDVVGNKKAIQSLLTWARSWGSGNAPKRPGSGNRRSSSVSI